MKRQNFKGELILNPNEEIIIRSIGKYPQMWKLSVGIDGIIYNERIK